MLSTSPKAAAQVDAKAELETRVAEELVKVNKIKRTPDGTATNLAVAQLRVNLADEARSQVPNSLVDIFKAIKMAPEQLDVAKHAAKQLRVNAEINVGAILSGKIGVAEIEKREESRFAFDKEEARKESVERKEALEAQWGITTRITSFLYAQPEKITGDKLRVKARQEADVLLTEREKQAKQAQQDLEAFTKTKPAKADPVFDTELAKKTKKAEEAKSAYDRLIAAKAAFEKAAAEKAAAAPAAPQPAPSPRI